MTKRILALVLVLVMACGILAGCGKKEITADEAWKIVQEDLGDAAAMAESPHVHTGSYNNQDCFNIFVTVNGVSLQYIISTTGKILHKGQGNHSH